MILLLYYFPPGMKKSLFEYNPLKSLGYVFCVSSACKFTYISECKYSGTVLYWRGHQNLIKTTIKKSIHMNKRSVVVIQ